MININGYIVRSGVIDYYYIKEDSMQIYISIKGTENLTKFEDKALFLKACTELEKDINREI